MEFRQLRYFLAVADIGSISKASERLFIAQSALSQQIARLEASLGVSVLHRSPRGISLTESGHAFYEHAQTIMRQIELARAAAVQRLSAMPMGAVTVGIGQSASAVLALPLFMAVRRELPAVTLQLTDDTTSNLISQLRRDQLNLAILFDDDDLGEFERRQIVKEHMYLIEKSDFPAEMDGEPVSLEDALKQPLLLPGPHDGIRQVVEKAATKGNAHIERLVAEVNSLNILKSATLAGVGATLMPLAPFHFEAKQGLIKARRIQSPEILRVATICISRHVAPTKAVDAVANLILQVVRKLCESGEWPGASVIADGGAKQS